MIAVYLLILLLGFAVLYYGAEWLVDGASSIAAHMNLSKGFVGLTLVAMGTSSPEFFVNVIAAFRGETEFALANVVGSNMTNLCIGFGIAALFCVVPILLKQFLPDLIVMLVSISAVLISFIWTKLSDNAPQFSIWTLAPLMGLLVYYIWSLSKRRISDAPPEEPGMSKGRSVVIFLMGVVALYIGGELTYQFAVKVATDLGISSTIIGLTIVAMGTSIPDVTASVVATRKREFGIAVGNLVGSNISNVLVVLSATLVAYRNSLGTQAGGPEIGGLPLIMVDYIVVTAVTLGFVLAMLAKQRVTKTIGISMLAVFVAYYVWRVVSVV